MTRPETPLQDRDARQIAEAVPGPVTHLPGAASASVEALYAERTLHTPEVKGTVDELLERADKWRHVPLIAELADEVRAMRHQLHVYEG